MLVQFNTLKNIVKVRSYNIDNFVFKLHYKLTCYLFIACSILVTLRQFIGDHIKCVTENNLSTKFIETFCFITTTFTVPKYFNVSSWKGIIVYPGVGPIPSIPIEEEIRRHAYYQWVPFLLLLQGLMFVIPHIIWKSMEGGKLRRLTEGFQSGIISQRGPITYEDCEILSDEEKNERIELICLYVDRKVLGPAWAVWLVLCEHLNLLNVIAQAFFIHLFLGRQFFGLGIYVIKHGLCHDVTILDYVFPKITKCTFHKYGPSGTIESYDALCVMPLNVINEKIYVFLWFWLLFVIICSFLLLIYRNASIALYGMSRTFNRMVFSFLRPVKLDVFTYDCLTQRYTYTEWLFLVYLEENMHGTIFREFLKALHNEPLLPKMPLDGGSCEIEEVSINEEKIYAKGRRVQTCRYCTTQAFKENESYS